MALHVETPLIESTPLSKAASCKVWLKLENCQPTASFKARGIGLFCSETKRAGKKGVICASGGNAGLAAAYACRKLNMPCRIYIPGSTSQLTIEKLHAEGAKVEVFGRIFDDANEEAIRQAELNKDWQFVHPFDHPTLWKGHSSMIHEIKRQIGEGVVPDCLVTSVGGGGLLAGIIQGLDEVGWSRVPVVAMETEGADCLAAALKAGGVVTIPDITSIATSLGSRKICEKAFQYTQTHNIISCVIPDSYALNACVNFADDGRMLVEPACGASLAVVYSSLLQKLQEEKKLPETMDNVIIVVCGGNGISLDVMNKYRSMLTQNI